MEIDLIAEQIRENIHEGSEALKNSATNAYVYEALRGYKKLPQVLIETPDKLMGELTKFLIDNLPGRPEGFDQVATYLAPAKEIARILDPNKLNDDVIIFPDKGCREVDIRMSLADFKHALRSRLFKGP